MYLSTNLCALTLRGVIGGACHATGVHLGEGAVGAVVQFLTRHFVDQSQRLTAALEYSNTRAWKALEVALMGESFWDRCKLIFTRADEKAFREQVKPFLKACPLAELKGKDAFRQACLDELKAAWSAGVLLRGNLDPRELAQKAGAFARFADPNDLLQAEDRSLGEMGQELAREGYANLAQLISIKPQGGPPLLILAARYFFRRAVEEDSALFQGLTFAQLEGLKQSQEEGLAALDRAFSKHAEAFERMLGEVQEAVTATHGAVLDVLREQKEQGKANREIYEAVVDLQKRFDMLGREVRPADSLSIRNDNERRLVKELVAKYRAIPEKKREKLPALLNAIGKLEVAAGEFDDAQEDFARVATIVNDSAARAEAHANAYRAALERRDWEAALHELRQAAAFDPKRFAPFPVDKYQPIRILGAGGFGVAFLCRHRFLKTEVVVKAILGEDLDRDVDEVFGEAHLLRQCDHPAIIGVQDCGFAAGESRPYLVMDYFDGVTLDELAREQPLSPEELVRVARQIASGLQAAHGKGILHRDVKPANILVRRPNSAGEPHQVKLIDFGLALRRTGRETMLASAASTVTGSSIAGTLEYAAPEQMGKLPGVAVSPASDVYGFARTCCYALFQTPQPLPRHWRSIPTELADLLENCLEDDPGRRPRDFASVLARLGEDAPARTPAPLTSLPLPTLQPSSKPVAEMTAAERLQELAVLQQQVAGCVRCTQLAFSRTQPVFGTGPLDPPILILGEAPGADEDRRGEPFVGAAGQLLTSILLEVGIRRDTVYITNVLKCRPPGNRKPQDGEVRNCRGYLDRQIDLVRPRSIIALGATAAQNLLQSAETIGKLRGRLYQYRGVPVLCTYHPAFLLPGRAPERKPDVLNDIRMLLRRLGE